MRARLFFAMLFEARRIRAWHLSELCDVAAIAIAGSDYHSKLKSFFMNRMQMDAPIEEPDNTPINRAEANACMIRLFALKKRSL